MRVLAINNMDFLNTLLPAVEYFGFWGYWLILLVILIESLAFIGLIIPGSLIMILTGFLAAKGFLHLGDLILFAGLGTVIGNGVSFYLGKSGGKFFSPESRIFKSSYLARGEKFFHQHGGKSLFFGQFISPMRSILSFVAGLAKMNTKKFFFWSIAGAFGWVTIFSLIGFFFGQAWRLIELWTTRISIFALMLVLFFIILYLLKRIILKKGRQFFAFIKSILISLGRAIVANADVQKLVKNHPGFFGFIKRRLTRNKFSGLPLTLLTVAFIYILSLFFGIIEDFITTSAVVAADIRIANLLVAFRHPQLIKIFFWITLLGKWEIVVSLAVVFSLVCWLWKKRVYILPLWFLIFGSEFFGFLGKLVFHRQRPAMAAYFESSFSFPSGHAIIAMAFYGFLTYFFWRQLKNWKSKINLLFAALIIILAIGFSRLYLGVHFFSDIWAGYLLGALWLIIGISLVEWFRARRKIESLIAPAVITLKVKIISLILILAELVFYINFVQHYNPPLNLTTSYPNEVVTDNILTFFQNNQLPKYTETLTGQHQEPLSFILITKNDQQLIGVFQQAGWYLADSVSFKSIVGLTKDALFNKSYPAAPMTPSFWNSGVHNFGFEKPTDSQSVRERHHARFWQTQFKTKAGKNIYFGTASLDVGLKWGITHKIKPDLDTERDFLLADLQKTETVSGWREEQFVEPAIGANFSGDQFFTNGKIYIVELK